MTIAINGNVGETFGLAVRYPWQAVGILLAYVAVLNLAGVFGRRA